MRVSVIPNDPEPHARALYAELFKATSCVHKVFWWKSHPRKRLGMGFVIGSREPHRVGRMQNRLGSDSIVHRKNVLNPFDALHGFDMFVGSIWDHGKVNH